MGKVYSLFTNAFSAPMNESETLFKSIEENDFKTLEVMLRMGADVSVRNDEGFTLLHCAAELGHQQCLHLLLNSNSVDINARDSTETPLGHFQTTALHLAAAEGYPHIVAYLLDCGADINAITITGWTALHFLIIGENMTIGKLESLAILIGSGADVNRRDSEGNLPIDTAILYGHYEVTRVLLNSGIDLNSLESIDPNLLERDEVYQCVELCLSAGCFKVIEKYDVIKYLIEGSKFDDQNLLLLQKIDKLLDFKYNVQSLKYLSRIAVRKCFSSRNLNSSINKLSLPDCLRWYLLLVGQ